MTELKAKAGIEKINLYEGGLSTLEGVTDVVKLSSNENPLGPSRLASKAFRNKALQLHLYPSADHIALRTAIAEKFRILADNIICGVGSDEILSFLCQAYAGPGDEVIHTEHGFALYRLCTLAAGAIPIEVAEKERVTDVQGILDACTTRTKIIFIANPNNPTGTMVSSEEIIFLADNVPSYTLLVLDGAYVDYIEDYDGGAKLVETRKNIFMTRTFSKLYGLGGMRVGWGYGHKSVIDNLNRIRGPFNLSSPALAAAEAAVKDQRYVEKCRSENNRLRSWLAKALNECGIMSDPSMGNFILARFKNEEEAENCDEFFKSKGLIVRPVGGYKLPHCLRISIGDEKSCHRVADAVKQFKAGKT